ncbi:MAG TPA: tetratricopeptide repeat protein [Candidatus Limnocylindria bacterium]|nr:tetratricopeptide repeat protein [Candidatus Limnocylindria bacterium]
MRPLLALAAAALIAFLGAVQLASTAAYGDLATRPSFPAFVHDVAPGLLRPLLGGPRAQAAAALHEGDLARAEQLLAMLPDDRESADLRGRLAEARGDRAGAIRRYVQAGDVVRAEALIDALAGSDLAAALAAQRELVATLPADASADDVSGDAWTRLGQLQVLSGYLAPVRRTELWREAQHSYERALAFAPNDATYLLNAANQALENGDTADALRWFRHADDVHPGSPDVYNGLALTEAARGDCARARGWLARWKATAAPGARSPLDDPLLGAPLRRCTT